MLNYTQNKLIIHSNFNISFISSVLKNFQTEIIDIDKKNGNFIYYPNKNLSDEALKIIKLILLKKIPHECRLYMFANSGLNLREINLIRAVVKYQKQLLFEFEELQIVDTLLLYPNLIFLIISYFKEKFLHTDFSKENENIRINANKTDSFCIIEGANLALTNKARYEYALKNLDAIDNSAGVSISDYEVNLKIVLNQLIEKKIFWN